MLMPAILFGLAMPAATIEARGDVRRGGINSGQLRYCENQTNDRWITLHAPTDHTFFHQEIVLGEGSYTLDITPNGPFRFNAFVYDAETRQYLGGARNVSSYRHRFRPAPPSAGYLVQLVKSSAGCAGCMVTMSLSAHDCPRRARYAPRSGLRP